MVLVSRLICSVCEEAYTNEDYVCATSCGHLYHQACIESWQSRSRNCPQCRRENPTSFRVFLQLEPGEDHVAKNLELMEQLEKQAVAASTMESQLKATESNLLELQEEFFMRESEFQVQLDEKETKHLALLEAKVLKISELESKLKEASEAFFDRSSPQIASHADTAANKVKNDLSSDWQIEKRNLEREIRQLNYAVQKALSGQADSSIELAKEIQISAKLAADKMKLEHELERAKEKIDSLTKMRLEHDLERAKEKMDTLTIGNLNLVQTKTQCKSFAGGHQANLAPAYMDGSVNNLPVALQSTYKLPVAQTTMTQPWHARQSQKNHVKTNGNSIDSNHPKFHTLYGIAKVLRSYGYKFIYIYKNQVFARVDKQSKPILIRDKDQVDTMVKFHEENRQSTIEQYLRFVDGLPKFA